MPNSYTIKNFSGYHFGEKPPKKLLEQVSDVIRLKHYSYKTETDQQYQAAVELLRSNSVVAEHS